MVYGVQGSLKIDEYGIDFLFLNIEADLYNCSQREYIV